MPLLVWLGGQAVGAARTGFHMAVAQRKIGVVRRLLARPASENERVHEVAAAIKQEAGREESHR